MDIDYTKEQIDFYKDIHKKPLGFPMNEIDFNSNEYANILSTKKLTPEFIDEVVLWIDPNVGYRQMDHHNLELLFVNPSLTYELFKKLPQIDRFYTRRRQLLKKLSSHPNVTYEWLAYNQDWDFKELSKHPNLSDKWIQMYPNADWDFDIINKRIHGGKRKCDEQQEENSKKIKVEEDNTVFTLYENCLEMFINEKPLNFEELSKDNNISIDFIKKYVHLPWVWYTISRHRDLSADDILFFKDYLINNHNYSYYKLYFLEPLHGPAH